MTIRVSVLSATNLSRSPSEPDICPTVSVWAHGPGRFCLGDTPETSLRHPQTPNPLWQVTFDVDWFRLSQLEFVISHFRPVVSNKKVARIRVPVAQIPLGKPFTVPVTYCKPGLPPAEFTFQIDLSPFTPFSPIKPKSAHKRLYVYATYDPPLPLAAGPPPATFSCVNAHDEEQRFSIFDESVHWQSIGRGSEGLVSFGPSGPTHVATLNRSKCDKSTSAFLVNSQSYTGLVTLNFLLAEAPPVTLKKVLTESPQSFTQFHQLPRNESRGLFLQSSVQVAPGTFACLPHAIRIQGDKYTVRQIAPAAIGPGGDAAGFARQVAKAICPDIVLRQRNLFHSTLPSSLSAAAASVGCAPPRRIGLVGACRPINHSNNYYITLALLAFDAAGRFLPAMPTDDTRLTVVDGPAFNGAIVPRERAQYQPDIGTFRETYYSDARAFDVDLDGLIGQGVASLAVAMFPDRRAPADRLAEFRRKAVRIVDPESKVEIGLAHVAAPWVSKKWGILAGGLVFVNDGWSWLPAADLVANESLPEYQARWYERLLQAQCVTPQ
jgi:hypothetical protein